jgi:uncharacterized membrane protein
MKRMKLFKIIVAVVILTAALVILVTKLFAAQPIEITLETGQEVSTQNEGYYTLAEVLLLVVCSFCIGSASFYLYYNAELARMPFRTEPLDEKYRAIIGLLKEDERRVMTELIRAKGELLQNALVEKLNVSKVKATRILARLEQKGLITKERHGFTNKIILKK